MRLLSFLLFPWTGWGMGKGGLNFTLENARDWAGTGNCTSGTGYEAALGLFPGHKPRHCAQCFEIL